MFQINQVDAHCLGRVWTESVISKGMNASVTMTVKMTTSVVSMVVRRNVLKCLVKNMVRLSFIQTTEYIVLALTMCRNS